MAMNNDPSVQRMKLQQETIASLQMIKKQKEIGNLRIFDKIST